MQASKRSKLVGMAAAGLLAVQAGWLTAQQIATVPTSVASAPVVIATSNGPKPPSSPPAETRLPLPDDGLSLKPPMPTPIPQAMPTPPVPAQPGGSVNPSPAPPAQLPYMPGGVPTANPTVQPAMYLPGQEGVSPMDAIRPTVSTQPVAPAPMEVHETRPRETTRPNVAGVIPRSASALSVEVLGPESAQPGQTMACQIVVRNLGAQTVSGVRLDLPMPTGLRLLASKPEATTVNQRWTWALGNLEGGGERRIELELLSGQSGEIQLGPTARFTAAMAHRTSVTRSPFGVTVNGPDRALVGETVGFQIEISNQTQGTLKRLHLRGELGEGLTHPQGQVIEADLDEDLAPGQVRQVQLEVQATRTGRHNIVVRAESDNGLQARGVSVVQVGDPAPTLTLQGPRQVRLGQTVGLKVVVSNPSRQGVGPLRVTQTLPLGVEFVSAGSGGVYNGQINSVTWVLQELRGGQEQTLNYELRARQVGDWAVAANLEGTGVTAVRSTHALQVEATPNLALEVTALDDPLPVGRETMYEIRVYNGGPTPARGVRVVAQVPGQMVPIHAEGPTPWQIRGQQVVFESLSEMGHRIDAVYRVRVRGERAGQERFRAEVYAVGQSRPLVQEQSSRVQGATASAGR